MQGGGREKLITNLFSFDVENTELGIFHSGEGGEKRECLKQTSLTGPAFPESFQKPRGQWEILNWELGKKSSLGGCSGIGAGGIPILGVPKKCVGVGFGDMVWW